MPFLLRATETNGNSCPKQGRKTLLDRTALNGETCEVSLVSVGPGQRFANNAQADDLTWFQVLSGAGTVNGQNIDTSSVVFAGPESVLDIEAIDGLELLWTRVLQAQRFDAEIAALARDIRLIDWGNEPVLQSEHDARTRIYVTTPTLVGTKAIKAEIISYPPGTSAPEHHHEGAEHFQFILEGAGTAVLEGVPHALGVGDILYNYPNERHWFYTEPDASTNFVFVEFFIPGRCKTVWTEEVKACAWLPTGSDARGEKPAREIDYHVHGQDDGL